MNGVACTPSPVIVARQSARCAGSQIACHESSQVKRQADAVPSPAA